MTGSTPRLDIIERSAPSVQLVKQGKTPLFSKCLVRKGPVMETSKLDQAISSFITFARSLPPRAMEPSRTDRWGPREVLIHLVFWHEQYNQIAAAVAANQQPGLFEGTFKEINRFAVTQNLAVSIEELAARWTKAQRALEHITTSAGGEGLKLRLRKGSKEWPLSVLVRLAARHIENHEAKLRKLLGRPKPRRSPARMAV